MVKEPVGDGIKPKKMPSTSAIFEDARHKPGGPVVRDPCSHCKGMGSIPGQGTRIP